MHHRSQYNGCAHEALGRRVARLKEKRTVGIERLESTALEICIMEAGLGRLMANSAGGGVGSPHVWLSVGDSELLLSVSTCAWVSIESG